MVALFVLAHNLKQCPSTGVCMHKIGMPYPLNRVLVNNKKEQTNDTSPKNFKALIKKPQMRVQMEWPQL